MTRLEIAVALLAAEPDVLAVDAGWLARATSYAFDAAEAILAEEKKRAEKEDPLTVCGPAGTTLTRGKLREG